MPLTLPCTSDRGPLLPVSLCASSREAAEGLVACFALMSFECAPGCERYAHATATESGTCDYDPALKRYSVTVTSYGCQKVREAGKLKREISEQIEKDRKK